MYLKANLILGYPVEYNETVEDSHVKYFYSAGISLFPDSPGWNANLYYLEQMADRVLDRREIVVDTMHQGKQSSFYSTVDYSLQYDTLNLFYATYNKRYQGKSSLNIVANYRKNPFLKTTNALLGQADASSITDLLETYSEDQIEQLALDRTASYKSLSAYYTHYINSEYQISTDVTAYNMSGTVDSAGVEAIQDTDNEYSYSLGLVGNNLFTENDVNVINLRRNDLATSDLKLLGISSRFRIDRDWFIKPGLSYETRDYDDGRTSNAIRPSISVKNRFNRNWQFEMEMSYDDKKVENSVTTLTSETNKRFYAGYVYTF